MYRHLPSALALVSLLWSPVAAADTGCGTTLSKAWKAAVGGSRNITLPLGDGKHDRDFIVHLPTDFDNKSPFPVVFAYHGRNKNSSEMEGLTLLSDPEYNPDFIAIYPNGYPDMSLSNPFDHRQWQGDPSSPSDVDDIQFTKNMLQFLNQELCLDNSRLFATGKSNGGGFVGLLACDPTMSATFAAFAPVAAALYINEATGKYPNGLPACAPSRSPIPILEMHGFLDVIANYNGGSRGGRGITVNIPQFVDDWATRDGFKPSDNTSKSICNDDKPPVIRYSWNEVVIHYNVSNAEHQWPAPFATDDDKSGKRLTCFHATKAILKWFRTITLPN